MNSKIYLIIAVIVLVIVGFMFLRTNKNNQPDQTILTNEIALFLLKDDLFEECRPERVEGKYNSCVVNISQDGNQWVITVTYNGLYDDSVKASRVQTAVTRKEGKWIKGDIFRSQQCWPGRGHQDFSAELCN